MDLFSDLPQPTSALLRIETPLSKDQKAFNTLIKKIEGRRALLVEWQGARIDFQQRYLRDLAPLQAQEEDLQVVLAKSLGRAYAMKGLSKTDRNKLAAMIHELTGMLLEARDDAELKALYNQHGYTDYDQEQAAEEALTREFFEQAFGVELDEDLDMSSHEDVAKHLRQHFKTQAEQAQAAAKPRKKTAKQLAKEAQLAAQEAQMSQSIREVFRKLASALHPDREQDPAEKQRKTLLMQRANDAYQKGNLLQLLELQLEMEHIDQAHLANLSADRLKHYLQILKGQLAEIEQEIGEIEQTLSFEFNIPRYQRLQPKLLPVLLEQDCRHCAASIDVLHQQIACCESPSRLKAWLKQIRLEKRSLDDFGDGPF